MGKIDIRYIPVAPQLAGKIQYCYMSSPLIFSAVANILEWIMAQQGTSWAGPLA